MMHIVTDHQDMLALICYTGPDNLHEGGEKRGLFVQLHFMKLQFLFHHLNKYKKLGKENVHHFVTFTC